MIIIQSPKKDTYVTDIQTSSNNALYSNVGQSSTIDIFKVVGENNKTFSRSLFTINNTIINGNTFTLKDSLDNNITFIIRTLELTVDGSVEGAGENKKVKVGLSGANTVEEKRDRFITALNNVNGFNNGLTFDISAYKLDNNKILLKQNKPGSSGDTIPVVPNNENSVTITNFVRFEHSAGLISFDLSGLKSKHVSVINDSAFSTSSKFEASIKLIDVGKSSTRPKNFSLAMDVLKNTFKEGLGKDVVHFSDIDDANFSVLNSDNNSNWSNEGIVSIDDLFKHSTFSFQNFEIEKGNENIEFDITNYVYEFFKGTQDFTKEDFVIHFPVEKLFDSNTYFVKRFGSRNLKNKQFIPQLLLKIDDDEIENIITEKKRYFDNEEKFFLLNIKGNKTSPFTQNQTVKLDIEFIGDNNTDILSINPKTGSSINNYKGDLISGIKKFTILETDLTQISSDTKFNNSLSKLDYVPIKFTYYYDTNPRTVIKEENVNFYKAEVDYSEISFNNSNIRVSIDILQKNIKANDSTVALKVSFIDINKQYKSVNKPIQLYSEDLGDITYKMYDVDSSKDLIENSSKFTKLKFNGKHYVLNIFASSNFKNKRVNFVFTYNDPLTGLSKEVLNDNTIIRFV